MGEGPDDRYPTLQRYLQKLPDCVSCDEASEQASTAAISSLYEQPDIGALAALFPSSAPNLCFDAARMEGGGTGSWERTETGGGGGGCPGNCKRCRR
jgi:hypothetical protein